jgi:CRISPR/Cas system CSM-associated protein Csm3 (group 7 of RAMP superfamily)
MARPITQRLKITGKLMAETPLHVGGLGTDPTVDLSLAVNGQSQEYIPGTSLAGAFRNWMEDCNLLPSIIESIWGFQREDVGHASFVILEDAVVTLPAEAIVELRDHVGIDRISGAASDKTKFDRAILPKGTTFPLEMTIDLGQDNPQALEAVEQLIHAIETDGLRLGGAKTRGLGLVKLTDIVWKDYDLGTFTGMIAALRGHGTDHIPTALSTSHLLRLSIHWNPIGALMVKSGQDGVAVDILPLVSRVGNETTFVLPGSAIKGALRSQAERILRTVLKQEQPPIGKLQVQLENSALALTQWLFGKSGTGNVSESVEFGRGALSVDDCYCTKRMKPSAWQAVEHSVDDRTQQNAGTLRGTLDAATLTDTQQAYHVAIDRWTGGAAEHMLYSALEPFNLTWEPIELTLNLNRIDEANRPAAKALLILVLRDIAQGRIPLGYGVNRGYGSLEVESVSLKGAALKEFGGDEIIFASDGSIAGIEITELGQAWTNWLETKRELLGVTA